MEDIKWFGVKVAIINWCISFAKWLSGAERVIYLYDKENDTQDISDGYHTFGELYQHRHALYLNYCKLKGKSWRSTKHNDGSEYKGWFILGCENNDGKQISYHLPMYYWKNCAWAETLEKGKKYDGHSADDVVSRLLDNVPPVGIN